jgi:hypothetical protein
LASGSEIPQVQFDGPGQITCEGILLDIVDGLGCISIDQTSSYRYDKDAMVQSTSTANVSALAARSSTADATRIENAFDLVVEICRCLVLDRTDRYLRHVPPTEELAKDFQMFCMTAMTSPSQVDGLFLEWFSSNRLFKIRGLELVFICTKGAAEVTKVSDLDFYDRSNWESFLSRFRDTTMKMARRLMVTNQGLIGMAPQRANKHDIICVLFGCSVPVMLRKRALQEEYEFIGECYVDGFMNGEALSQVREGHGFISYRSFRIT